MAKRTKATPSSPATKRISPKEAVIAATKHFTEVTGITSGVSVEELELTEDAKYWIVTLGYIEPARTLAFTGPKSFKTFKIDATTGDVLSMKIREV